MNTQILKRALLVLAIFIPLVFLLRLEVTEIGLLIVDVVLGLIPGSVLLVLTILGALLSVVVFRHQKLKLALLMVLTMGQAVIFFCWMKSWTAGSAWGKYLWVGA